MKRSKVDHVFVEYIPKVLKDGTIYISMTYATAAHSCCCGCGNEIVTPLSPTDWELTFDGQSISLNPSIGNWSLPCQSHYWIERNRVKWDRQWTKEEIRVGRAQNRMAKHRYFQEATVPTNEINTVAGASEERKPASVWSRLRKWWS